MAIINIKWILYLIQILKNNKESRRLREDLIGNISLLIRLIRMGKFSISRNKKVKIKVKIKTKEIK